MNRIGMLDLPSGIAGDMFLGALVDAGASLEAASRAVEAVTGGRATLRAEAVHRGSLRATRVTVLVDGTPVKESGGPVEAPGPHLHAPGAEPGAPDGPGHEPGPTHAHGHEHEHTQGRTHEHEQEHGDRHAHPHNRAHGHATLDDVLGRIHRGGLEEQVSEPASRVYRLLAEAEGRVHGVEPAAVHFHEVGSLDAVADVVGTVAALASLELDALVHGPVALGGGSVVTDHGVLAVPAPATLELLTGRPCTLEPDAGELTTPTGAALLSGLARPVPSGWAFRPGRVGYGAGARNPEHRPNVARLVLGTAEGAGAGPARVAVVEASLDDTTPEDAGHLLERLLEEGALDVTLSPLLMKKSRPGFLVRIVSRPEEGAAFAERLVQWSSSLGARWRIEDRRELPRRTETVRLADGSARVKVATLPDGTERIHVEHEDLAALARARGLPLWAVREEVERAWWAAR